MGIEFKISDLDRKFLFDQGLKALENLFPGNKVYEGNIIWDQIEISNFSSGYGLVKNHQEQLRSSKRKYDLKHLLRYVGLNVNHFKGSIFKIECQYDVIVYGYNKERDEEFLIVGKRIFEGDAIYYMQSTLKDTITTFKEIQGWFDEKEEEKQQNQNSSAAA